MGAAQQPGLRAFPLFDRLPAGCLAFTVSDGEAEPHLRPGEIAIVDPADREPTERDLFLIEWGRSAPAGPRRHVVETFTRPIRNSERGEFRAWFAGDYARPRSHEAAMADARRTGVLRGFIDGPYGEVEHLSEVLIGRVVGILQPRYEEPRLAKAGDAK